ncbi:MAG: hypothetical protein R3Y27_03040 [Clostridia bacterium]
MKKPKRIYAQKSLFISRAIIITLLQLLYLYVAICCLFVQRYLVFSLSFLCFVICSFSNLSVFYQKRLSDFTRFYGDKFESYNFFSKQKCTVDLNKPIYYALFVYRTDRQGLKEFIAISNEKFCYKTQIITLLSNKMFIYFYDRNDIIVFEYNDKNKKLCEIKNWENVRKY